MASEIVERLKTVYNQLTANNLTLLEEVYSDDVVFQDPFHRIEGLPSLISHFEGLYRNLSSIHFDYLNQLITDEQAYLTWQMDFSHSSIGRGKSISIPGVTYLKFDTKVHFHQDYFDTSAMLYHHLPVIGTILKWIQKRV